MTAYDDTVNEMRFGARLERAEAEKVVAWQGGGRHISQTAVATGYVNAVHPDTGLAVVFLPGEAIPEWAAEEALRDEQAKLNNRADEFERRTALRLARIAARTRPASTSPTTA